MADNVTNDVRVFFEAESRVHDAQAVTRRTMLKKRDAGDVRVVLVLADTRTNRAIVRGAEGYFREAFPAPPAVVRKALRLGIDPGADGLILV